MKELKIIIDKEELKVKLYKNYRETLEEYLRFSENHKYDNTNNFEIEIWKNWREEKDEEINRNWRKNNNVENIEGDNKSRNQKKRNK